MKIDQKSKSNDLESGWRTAGDSKFVQIMSDLEGTSAVSRKGREI